MAAYQSFVAVRTTEPDATTLLNNLRAFDATIGVQHIIGNQEYILKKNTNWTQQQISAAQNVLNTSSESSPQLNAQAAIDSWPIEFRALISLLMKEINILRQHPAINLPPRTLNGVLAAIRNEAKDLT